MFRKELLIQREKVLLGLLKESIKRALGNERRNNEKAVQLERIVDEIEPEIIRLLR